MSYQKIINDPVYGFLTVDDQLVLDVISHPYFQRLRRIHQMALADLVYPGAVHSRLHHALGAYHLMCTALAELERKGIAISAEEKQAAKIAILLHDIGHGPYSHALEGVLVGQVDHETISMQIIERINAELNGKLQLALEIFTGKYHKKFLHQLVSGQLDVDRMDYLIRDSFYSGVTEGVIGYDRIIKMMSVYAGELVVEEKGIYSIEKFLVSRRFMYWQVYLHKTVLAAEQMLVRIVKRAQQTGAASSSPMLNQFLLNDIKSSSNYLDDFCRLDDHDVMCAIKQWADHKDIVLSALSSGIINRQLLKIKFYPAPANDDLVKELKKQVAETFALSANDTHYLVFGGEAVNNTYSPESDHIRILFKDGSVKDISEVDNPLINQTLFAPTKKFYICYPGLNSKK